MKKENKIIKVFRYFSLLSVIGLGLVSIIGTGGGGGDGGTAAVYPRFAYVANQGSKNVSQYTIGADGTLAPMTPATVTAGNSPRSVTVDPSGNYAYVGEHDQQ